MRLTYKCKIINDEVNQILDGLGQHANSLYNCALWECNKAWKETGKIPSKRDVRDLLRANGNYHFRMLSSNCAEETVFDVGRAFRSWFKLRKKDAKARPPRYKKSGAISTFQHTANCGFKFTNDHTIRLSLSKLAKAELAIRYIYIKVSYPPQLDVKKVKSIKFVKNGEKWFIHCVMKFDVDVSPSGNEICAIDLGIANFAVLASTNGYTALYSGRELLSKLRYYNKEIAKCKPRNWKPGSKNKGLSRRAKRLYKKRGDIQKEFIHSVTKDIIRRCVENGIGTIFIGDLTNIRKGKNYGKKVNQKLHNWPFNDFTEKLSYKAELSGIRVVKVSEAYTSQTCSRCGIRKKSQRVSRGLYVCECGNVINADLNGAINILKKYTIYTINQFDIFKKPDIILYRPSEPCVLKTK